MSNSRKIEEYAVKMEDNKCTPSREKQQGCLERVVLKMHQERWLKLGGWG